MRMKFKVWNEKSHMQLALNYVKARKKATEDYYKAVEDARKNGTNYPYCVHGTYVGDPFGPDYMCRICESGEENIYADALVWADGRYARINELLDAVEVLHREGFGMDIVGQVIKYAVSLHTP